MDSFKISKELIEQKTNIVKYTFGNMRFFNKGNKSINKKSRGIYITIFMLIGFYILISYIL